MHKAINYQVIYLSRILIDWSDTEDIRSSASSVAEMSFDVADDYWASGLSPGANLKRFKAIRAGLLLNLNESVRDLGAAIETENTKDVQYHLRKMMDKWNRLENLQKTIVQLIPDDDLDTLVEESRLFEDNRDVIDTQRELANEFLMKIIPDDADRIRSNSTQPS